MNDWATVVANERERKRARKEKNTSATLAAYWLWMVEGRRVSACVHKHVHFAKEGKEDFKFSED